jgi:hypothetical protein
MTILASVSTGANSKESYRFAQAEHRPVTVFNLVGFTIALLAKNTLEIMFFAGIIGCVAVIMFSWVSILKSAFSDDSSSD